MEFSINSPILFLLSGIVVAVVIAQSVFFLVKAWRQGKKIGMPVEKLKRIAISSAIFTIAPATAIVISVISLSKKLGIPLPWMRLSVVGAITYETPAAVNALSAMGLEWSKVQNLTASQYVTVAAVMTMGIMVGIWLVPLVAERMQKGIIKLEQKDKKWSDIFSASLFLGMISAFLGYVFADFSTIFHGDTSGLVPVVIMFFSAAVMGLCGFLMKKLKWNWMNDYALPISLVAGMASAIPITAWLG